MGFLDELNSNAKTRAEFEKEQSNQRKIEEKRREIEVQNSEKAKIIEYKKNLEPFIEIIKNVCLQASQQGIYTKKNNQNIIEGYIYIFEPRDRDGDSMGITYVCNAYTLKKKHMFKEHEYNIVSNGMNANMNKYAPLLSFKYYDSRKKYEKVFLDFIKEQIPEISLGKEQYIDRVFDCKVIFARSFSIVF